MSSKKSQSLSLYTGDKYKPANKLSAIYISAIFVSLSVILFVIMHKHPSSISRLQVAAEENSVDKVTAKNDVKLSSMNNIEASKTSQDVVIKIVSDSESNKAPTINDHFINKITELFELGIQSPQALFHALEKDDPFQTDSGPDAGFLCPTPENSFDFPSIINQENLNKFKRGDPDSFIFYQHLRKAGGTGFCDMAKSNLLPRAVPPYYCMPDDRGSLATPPWNDQTFLLEKLRSRGHRIAANEWDAFYTQHASIPGVVLATTFRDPIDRWFSQYRFEHLEHRDGSQPDAPRMPFLQWYNNQKGWTMGTNYYVKTFIGTADLQPTKNRGDFYWTYHKFQRTKLTLELFLAALENVRKFHLVLVTEWLSSSEPLIRRVLDWTSPPRQVLPHEVQAVRSEKKSKSARDSIPPEDFMRMVDENIFDILLFHIVKRMYLERLACLDRS